MSKIAKRWQITEVSSVMIDADHKVDLSHNDGKTKWYITVKGEFYTEFTFDNRILAQSMYKILVECKSIYMDSLLVKSVENYTTPKISDVKAVSPDAIDYELACRQTNHALDDNKMSDAEILAYEEGT